MVDKIKHIFIAGADPGFQVGGGGYLKKIAPSGGRRENVWCMGAPGASPPFWIRPCIVLRLPTQSVFRH